MNNSDAKNIRSLRDSFEKLGFPQEKIEEALGEVLRILGTTALGDKPWVAERASFTQEEGEVVEPAQEEKRNHPRIYPKALEGVLVSVPEIIDDRDHIGLVNDTSSEGIGITSTINVPIGTLMRVSLGESGGSFLGEVRWCVPAGWETDIYYLGIKAFEETDE